MLNVLDWLRKRSPTGRTAANLYGSIVTQSRKPAFYNAYGVPDTLNGRYELIVVHMTLALAALKASVDEQSAELARALVEHFVTDMDDSLRQLAVGDMSVPKKVKKAAAGLRERSELYAEALGDAGATDRLALALNANIFDAAATGSITTGAARLANYMRACHAELRVSSDGMLQGFVDPDVISANADTTR